MNGSDITLTIGILVIFVYLFAGIVLAQGINHIKKNWSEYKCHPSIIPTASLFGHNVEENFIECITSMGSLNFDLLSQPFQHLSSGMSSGMGGISGDINSSRGALSHMQGMFGSGMGGMFGIFTNIIIVVKQLAATMGTIVYSIFAIVATIGRMIQGLQSTMHGIWKGKPGGVVRTLAG